MCSRTLADRKLRCQRRIRVRVARTPFRVVESRGRRFRVNAGSEASVEQTVSLRAPSSARLGYVSPHEGSLAP